LRLLLDTNVLLWWLTDSDRLVKQTRTLLLDASDVYVSAASAWEMAIKSAIGKLRAPDDLESQMRASQFIELPVKISHARAAAQLPRHHGDPFDRLLIAQAAVESLTLLTSDKALEAYAGSILFA